MKEKPRSAPEDRENPASWASQQGLPQFVAEVKSLPEDLQALVDRMLVEGATFEDVVEAVSERKTHLVTLSAVENFFRTNLDLQKRRIERQAEAAREMTKGLGGPRSAERKLAQAVVLTGLMGLSRGGAQFSIKEAEMARIKRENLRLNQHLLRLKKLKALQDRDVNRARIRHELERWRMTRAKLRQLRQLMRGHAQGRSLGPRPFKKFRKFTGL